jgi:rhamnosyltransferase
VLCIDQDTVVTGPMLETLRDAYGDHAPARRVGVVGSRGEGERISDCGGRSSIRPTHVITSGSLASVDAFRDIGPFREDFFIDFVDIEWCLRLRARGYLVVLACRPTMLHPIGRPRLHRVLRHDMHSTHHDAARRYYITRNRVTVWRRYGLREPRFLWDDLKNFVKETVKVLLVEDDRWHKATNIARGLGDALRGRMGPIGSLYPGEA